jgi:H+/Cl- antiporter ClcA
MKTCPFCKIEVGGNPIHCPFCQNTLIGEVEVPYWPTQTTLKKQSVLYKIQLCLLLSFMVFFLALDFLLGVGNSRIHWSLLLSLWLLSFEFGLIRLFKKSYSPSRILTLFVLILTALILITGYFTGYWHMAAGILVPILCIGTLIANFVLALVDKVGNAMVYLLSNILFGVLPYLVLFVMRRDIPVAWIVCLITSVIILINSCILRGRQVLSELQRRFNM